MSSTFRDLESEREILRREAFPIVRRACEERGLSFYEIDLRWGVTREEAEGGEVLPICLQEIDRCRPYVLGLIGGRYGWGDARSTDVIAANERFKSLTPYEGRSITELELRYAIVDRPPTAPEPIALIYRRPTDLIDPSDFEAIARLTQALAASGVPLRDTPKNLQEFSNQVRDDLLEAIVSRFVKPAAPSENMRLMARDVATALAHRFVDRQSSRELVALTRRRARRIVVIGSAGCGKSMIAAALFRSVARNGRSTEIVAALNPAGWRDWAEAFWAVVDQLRPPSRRRVGQHKGMDARGEFQTALEAATERKHVIAVIDGVVDANLSERQIPAWLPDAIGNATIVVTIRADQSYRSVFQRAGWQVVVVDSLAREEITELAQKYFTPLGRRLDARQLDVLKKNHRSSVVLALILAELRCVPRFEALDLAVDRLSGITEVEEILDVLIDRLKRERGCSAELALRALALAPDGLSEAVLRAVAGQPGEPLAPLPFEILRQDIEGLTTVAGDRIAFRSPLFAEHLLRRLLPNGIDAARQVVIDHIKHDPEAPGSAEELLRQFTILGRWDELADALVDPNLFDPIARRAGQQLRAYWARLRREKAEYELSVHTGWAAVQPVRRVAEAAAVAEDLGDLATAQFLAEDAQRRSGAGDVAALALATSVLAGIAEAKGEFDTALKLLGALEADEISAALPQACAEAAVRRARIILVRSGTAAARHSLGAAATAVARAGDDGLRAVLLAMRASLALYDSKVRLARRLFEELLALGDRLGDLAVLATGHAGMAKVERERGKLRRADELSAKALRFAGIVGDERITQEILGVSGRVAMDLGNLDRANEMIRERIKLTHRIRDIIGELEAESDLARLYARLGDLREADRIMSSVKERALELQLRAFEGVAMEGAG